MNVKILLPNEIFAQLTNVTSVVAETPQGSFGILPNRLDCVTPLVPGILTYQTSLQDSHFIAVDQGILVKTAQHVIISVRRAIRGNSLEALQQAVKQEFLTLDQEQQALRSVLAKLETGFLKQFSALSRQ
ncbi:F0F1 ATP synthase subunit epsilon [Paraglaciecola sp. 20A4]|uniref:F0F1 ATP synthase subunit epsilon n=1 Tax=Paraglaciecola sp. 20A4 TaxID=2687288 RepID=UPI00140CCE4D|nr:F0F1 ATP synthase subunit epsilon [Paraglaciecola sp. 20A4]